MTDWQKRVVDEKEALDEKRVKLLAFIQSEASAKVEPDERLRLVAQLHFMDGYSQVLANRIANFK